MSSIIEKMHKACPQLAADISTWQKLRHTKKDLELFLEFNVAELEFKSLDGKDCKTLCTGSLALIDVLKACKPQLKEAAATKHRNGGMRSPNNSCVHVWDIVEMKPKSIPLESWQIAQFITLSESNLLMLD